MDKEAKFVWFKCEDNSRNPYAAFRREFTVTNVSEVKEAVLNIFADTVYKLYINGRVTGFGPIRFDPKYPVYDTYDLSPYLINGNNVIAVLVNYHGHKTFKNIPNQAAMIAWGSVAFTGGSINLSTGKESWKCRDYTACLRYTPKLSFALNAQIYYDQAGFDEDWISPHYNSELWPDAIWLKNQNSYGKLVPREIPFMSLEPIKPGKATRLFPHVKYERTYSFFIEIPFQYYNSFKHDPPENFSRYITWSTWIYSPCRQDISSGILYETVWVNGKPCKSYQDSSLRFNVIMPLDEGLNYIFGMINLYQDIYDCYLTLPENRGLILSADKNTESGFLFRHTHIVPKSEDEAIRSIPTPWPEDICLEHIGGWVYTTSADAAASPCRECARDIYAPEFESIEAEIVEGFVIKKSLYPNGVTLSFDLSHMRLLFPRLIIKGVKGAVIDLIYGDRYTEDGQHLRSLSWVPLGDRLVCSNETIDWSPVLPRGFRFLNVTIRDAAGDISLEKVEFISAQYPVRSIGRFKCSDSALNRIWQMGELTQSINMEDAYDDCVDRERGLYALDMLIQYHVNLACFGDQMLMKRGLELFAQSLHPDKKLFRCIYPNTGSYILPDFALYIVEGFYSYYLQTGDTELIETWWDAIMTNIGVFNALSDLREDLLLSADPPDSEATDDKRTGFIGDGSRANNTGVNCLFSCMYLLTLRYAALLADAIKKESDKDALLKRIGILEESIPLAFWSEKRGLFADNTKMDDFSPHASLFAIRAEVVSEDRLVVVKKQIKPLLTPFFKNGYSPSEADGTVFSLNCAYYMLDALYKAGMFEMAEYCMREGWKWFLARGLDTVPEHFDMQASNCHAWSASPTYFLSRHVLGVCFEIINGIDTVTIDVKTGDIDWAEGVFPHPSGEIEVRWHKENGRVVFDKISVPEGVSYIVKTS